MKYLTKDQNVRFEHADDARSRWVMQTAIVRQHEGAILDAMEPLRGPILELGAGEGLLLALRPDLAKLGYVGCDLHLDRTRRIQQHAAALARSGTLVQAICCDAARLPFVPRSFATVICRDLLHHLEPEQRRHCLTQIAQALLPDGTLIVVEPNGRSSPLVRLFSTTIATERMALEFSSQMLVALLTPHFADVHIDHIEASMLYRAVLHYRFGLPGLSQLPLVQQGLQYWESCCHRLAPQHRWTYVRARCTRPLHGSIV